MKTNRRFLLVASLALALAFTISCSDDDSLPSLISACKHLNDGYPEGETCGELYGDEKYKKQAVEECEEYGGIPVKKCPKGGVECPSAEKRGKKKDILYTEFFYDEKFKKMTCKEIYKSIGEDYY